MNYFGHAAVAVLRGGTSAFILGAMLPDLLAMVRGKLSATEHADLSAGVQFHLDTDAVFHQTRTFTTQNRKNLALMRERGVSRGPARACAHIGVEMLMDAELADEPSLAQGYLNALHAGAHQPELLLGLESKEKLHLQGLCEHLLDLGLDAFAPTEARFIKRLGNTLHDRPRLAPTESELVIISKTLSENTEVRTQVPTLMKELEGLTGLAPPG